MPLYDYTCVCGFKLTDHQKKMADPNPQHCGQEMQQKYGSKIEVYDTSMVFEHIAQEPMQFRNKRELRRYCRDHGMTSHLAE